MLAQNAFVSMKNACQALLKIKNINDQLTHDLDESKKALAHASQDAANAHKNLKFMSDKLNKAEGEVSQLLEQVEAATGAEAMVESLTDTNLELEMRVRELEEVGQLSSLIGYQCFRKRPICPRSWT